MRLDDETWDALAFAAVPWDRMVACAHDARAREMETARAKGAAAYRRRRNDPAFRARNALRVLNARRAKLEAEGKPIRTRDKKLDAAKRAEIAASSEPVRALAERYGVSRQAIHWIKKQGGRA